MTKDEINKAKNRIFNSNAMSYKEHVLEKG